LIGHIIRRDWTRQKIDRTLTTNHKNKDPFHEQCWHGLLEEHCSSWNLARKRLFESQSRYGHRHLWKTPDNHV